MRKIVKLTKIYSINKYLKRGILYLATEYDMYSFVIRKKL